MWPWGHFAVGYITYSLLVHLHGRRPPTGPAAIAVVFGTQFPDLVDKPLAWTFGVIPNGRSLTHSLFAAALVILVVQLLLRRRGHAVAATAFAVGYLTHLFGDALAPVLSGDFYALGFLAWPLVPAISYGTEQSFAAHLRKLSLESLGLFEFGFAIAVVLLWLTDGAPGVGIVAAFPRWVGRKFSA